MILKSGFLPLTPEERARRRAAKAARPVTKRTEATTPRPKERRIVVTVYPAGMLGLRPERCRREELLDIGAAYCIAVKARVLAERNAKRKGKS